MPRSQFAFLDDAVDIFAVASDSIEVASIFEGQQLNDPAFLRTAKRAEAPWPEMNRLPDAE
ncbi:MAG: hypothetical protein AB7G08_30875 [Hyphomicrobiaceae bacterium]